MISHAQIHCLKVATYISILINFACDNLKTGSTVLWLYTIKKFSVSIKHHIDVYWSVSIHINFMKYKWENRSIQCVLCSGLTGMNCQCIIVSWTMSCTFIGMYPYMLWYQCMVSVGCLLPTSWQWQSVTQYAALILSFSLTINVLWWIYLNCYTPFNKWHLAWQAS